MLDPIGTSVLRSNINSYLGMLLVGACALFAGIYILQAAFGYNPIVHAFETTVYRENFYTPSLP